MTATAPGGHRRSRLPELGRRGEGWLAAQLVLIAAVLLSALAGRDLRGPYAIAAYALGAALLATGLFLLAAGAVQLGPALTPLPAPRRGQELTTTGLYARVRHPMYGGGILIALGWSILFATVAGLALTVALALLLELKSRREEAWLAERLAGYESYRRRTPRKFVPFVY